MGTPRERYGPLVHRSVHHAAILWISGILIFLGGQIATQLAWDARAGNPTYSLTQNYISDLGAIACGTYSGRFVCSPWHEVFNVSIILMGILLILGVLLIPTAFPARSTRRVGLGLLAISGVGAMGVGLSPEDFNPGVHYLSAGVAFVAVNLALVVLGLVMFRDTRWDGWRAYTVLSGIVGFASLGFLVGRAYTWGGFFHAWGAGGMERMIVAPMLLWAVLVSVHLLRIPSFAPRQLPKSPGA